MTDASQFRHSTGRNGKVESICMNCLLAVGICSSAEELLAKESGHACDCQASKIEQEALSLHSAAKKTLWR
jgi:hypothetical protein